MEFKQLPPPPKSNKQVQSYVKAVEKGLKSYFVTQNGQGWRVREVSDRKNPGKLFSTKREAVQVAHAGAAEKDGQVFVFNQKGRLLSRSD